MSLRLKLNGKARAILKRKHRLKATLTVLAANAQGESQTTTRTVVIKSAAHRKKR